MNKEIKYIGNQLEMETLLEGDRVRVARSEREPEVLVYCHFDPFLFGRDCFLKLGSEKAIIFSSERKYLQFKNGVIHLHPEHDNIFWCESWTDEYIHLEKLVLGEDSDNLKWVRI